MDLVGQSTRAGREVPVCRSRAGAAPGDARLRALDAGDPRRARVGRGHRERPHRRGSRSSSRSCSTSRTCATFVSPPRASRRSRSTSSSDDVLEGLGRLAAKARSRGVSLALHTHANHARQITPLVAAPRRPCSTSGSATSATRPSSCGVSTRRGRPARPVPRVARPRLDHAVLRVPVRHGPERRALADDAVGSAGDPVGDHGLPSRLCDATSRLRRAAPREDVGAPGRGVRSRARHQPLARERLGGRRRADGFAEYYDPIHSLPEPGQAWWRADADGR